MRVLLLHEMSGVHTELKAGLLAIGVEAQVATFGDGWKQYSTDISLGRLDGFAKGSISKLCRQFALGRQLQTFDVVQSISPTPFFRPINQLLQDLFFRDVKRVVYLAAGSDAIYRKHVRSLPYFPPHDWYVNNQEYTRLDRLLGHAQTIIPVCYEYEYCMEKDGRAPIETIPFPVRLSVHHCKPLAKTNKLRIFHPLNRLNPRNDFKGTSVIKSVFAELNSKYSDVAEFIIAGGMSHSDYNNLTDSVDIIVDQVNSMSYGMSAAYGLAKGKVVLSGSEEATKNIEHYRHSPVINAHPDADRLARTLESLILDRRLVRQIGESSRSYAETFHDHVTVAHRFAEVYSKTDGK